jgi:uncharacterized protein YbjT (DUF2867 family)
MMAGKILVTGAPGNVGSEVVNQLRETGADFRVGAYNVDKAREALGDDLEIVHFDFLNASTYHEAFLGVERMFLVRPPQLANVQKEIAPAIYAAVGAGVQHVVFLSLQGVEKNKVVPHHKIEGLIREVGLPYTFLRASFFMQNLTTTHRAEIRDDGEIAVPVGKARTSFIDARDIGAVAVRALTEDGHVNQCYTITGSEALDYYTVARTLSEVLGRRIEYTDPSVPRFFVRQVSKGTKIGYAFVMTMLYTITRMGNAESVTNEVPRLLGREPISFRQFAEDNREVWVPNSG